MTLRDPEVLETLRDEPELLALADAVADTQRLRRPPRRRSLARPLALAAAGAAALVTVLLWPGGGSGNPILDRALAAIGDGRVLHLGTRVPVGAELINLSTGRTIVPTYQIESWSDRSSTRFHLIFRYQGRIVGEAVHQAGSSAAGQVDPAYTALWSGYRQALASGEAKLERSGKLYGRPIYWLRFPSLGHGRPGSLVAIDRGTYKPVAFRFAVEGRRPIDYRILLARTEPYTPATFRRRTKQASPLGGSLSHGSGVVGAPPSVKLGKGWLRAGPRLAGLRLSSTHPMSVESNGHASTGLELVYGTEQSARSITISELKRPDDPASWKTIPKGWLRLQAGEESSGRGASHPFWTGQVVLHGLYVTIETGVSKRAVLQAVRALRPV